MCNSVLAIDYWAKSMGAASVRLESKTSQKGTSCMIPKLTKPPGRKEAANFLHACQAVHAILAGGKKFTSHDRYLIESSAIELLRKVRLDPSRDPS